MQERVTYLERLVKTKDENMFKLEERASQLEGDVHRIQEEYREMDNRRQRQFFRTRFDPLQNQNNINMAGQGPARGQSEVARRIETAAGLTHTETRRIDVRELDRVEYQQRAMTIA